jgi:hypothetical protein
MEDRRRPIPVLPIGLPVDCLDARFADRIREPPWFKYPRHFMRAVKRGILDLDPWQLLAGKWQRVRLVGLTKGDRAWLAHFLSSQGAPS